MLYLTLTLRVISVERGKQLIIITIHHIIVVDIAHWQRKVG